jgi:hypothetical protein
MSDTTAGSGRRRRAWPLTARSAGAIIAMAILAIPAAAFGGSRSSTVALGTSTPRPSALSQSTGTQKALAYSRCMRSHGVSNFPDPSSSGVIPKVSLAELGVSSSQFEAAEKACQALLPPGTDDQFPPGEVQQLLIGMLRFSGCMRSHGVPNWPDPTTDSEGRPIFPLPEAGISHQQARSSQVTRAAQACQHLLPAALAGIPIG